jgi:hypothetical protein
MNRKWCISLACCGVAGIGLLIPILDRTGRVQGFLRGEAFFRGYPTSYWREILRSDGQSGTIKIGTVAEFDHRVDAMEVLKACSHDPDPAVRWPAVCLMGDCGRAGEALPSLRQALKDNDLRVRLHAVLSLGRLASAPHQLAPDLAELLHDPEPQVVFVADSLLWHMDVPLALKAGGWQSFTSADWKFSAVFPATPEEKKDAQLRPFGQVAIHSFSARHGATECVIGVSEPVEMRDVLPGDEWFNAFRQLAVPALGGKLTCDEAIEKNGQQGRDFVVETPEGMKLRTRLFPVGNRLYQILVAYDGRFLIAPAADYFLDSFRLQDDTPAKKLPHNE